MTDTEMLYRLLTEHFYRDSEGNLTWSYIEGCSIRTQDEPLADAIEEFMTRVSVGKEEGL